jgi:hypothetical protein
MKRSSFGILAKSEQRAANSGPVKMFLPKILSMMWLYFFSRVAFICNICFLIAFSVQLTHWIKNEQLTSTIILIGYVMGFIINPFVNLSYLFTALISRKKLAIVPAWLITANILFLVIQILYIFYLNDSQHS